MLLLLFFQENALGFFTTVFLECFHFFTTVFQLFLFHDCIFFRSPTFFAAFCQVHFFHVANFFCYFLSGTSFLCCCTRVLRIWERDFILKHVLPYSPSRHLAQPAFIKASLGASSSSLKVSDLPLSFETQTRPICLFESHSVQLKVLVGRFYLCVKALRNTISTLNPHFNNYIYCIVHVISTWPQKRFMKDDIQAYLSAAY